MRIQPLTHNVTMSYPANKWAANQNRYVFININEVKCLSSAIVSLRLWNLNKHPKIGFATLVSPRGEESMCAVDQMTS